VPGRLATEFETTAQGYRLATSVGGVLTGRSADITAGERTDRADRRHGTRRHQKLARRYGDPGQRPISIEEMQEAIEADRGR
jgi:hypothetical protein